VIARRVDSTAPPMGGRWPGYMNPFEQFRSLCGECDGSGSSEHALRLFRDWYGGTGSSFRPEDNGLSDLPAVRCLPLARRNIDTENQEDLMREARRLAGFFNRAWRYNLNELDIKALAAAGRLPKELCNGEVKLPGALRVNAWARQDIVGHDSVSALVVVRARCQREGKPFECAECGGMGDVFPNDVVRQQCDSWKPQDPPVGAFLQMWTGDGPVSPVMSSAVELAEWCADNLLEGPDDEQRHSKYWECKIHGDLGLIPAASPLSEKAFRELYDPEMSDEGSYRQYQWHDGEERAALMRAIHEERCWTMLETDGEWALVWGNATVNRMFNVICANPVRDEHTNVEVPW